MANVNCLIKSVDLKAGETFILPLNAELISASNSSNITSSCGDITVEQSECYLVYFGESNAGSLTPTYGDIYINGVSINGVKYMFSTDYSPIDISGTNPSLAIEIKARLDEVGIGGLFTGLCGWADTVSGRGTVSNLVFKTIPSVGNNMEFLAGADSLPLLVGNHIPVRFPVLKYADGLPGQHFCDCANT